MTEPALRVADPVSCRLRFTGSGFVTGFAASRPTIAYRTDSLGRCASRADRAETCRRSTVMDMAAETDPWVSVVSRSPRAWASP